MWWMMINSFITFVRNEFVVNLFFSANQKAFRPPAPASQLNRFYFPSEIINQITSWWNSNHAFISSQRSIRLQHPQNETRVFVSSFFRVHENSLHLSLWHESHAVIYDCQWFAIRSRRRPQHTWRRMAPVPIPYALHRTRPNTKMRPEYS